MTKRATPTTPFRRVWAIIIENSLLLLAGTVAGLVWANLARHRIEASLRRFGLPSTTSGWSSSSRWR